METFQSAKAVVLAYYDAMEHSPPEDSGSVLDLFMSEDYTARSVYPFRELSSKADAAAKVWCPLKSALCHMQRRMDIFIAGANEMDGKTWVMSMGHFMGLFDRDFLGIRHTGKMASLRYAEFNCVERGKITQTGLFLDLIGLMTQAGMNPLPPSTGQYFIYPGPRLHDGLLFKDATPEEGGKLSKLSMTWWPIWTASTKAVPWSRPLPRSWGAFGMKT